MDTFTGFFGQNALTFYPVPPAPFVRSEGLETLNELAQPV
jgi:hypothetical protein